MEFKKRPEGRVPPLRPSSALLCGAGLAGVLFGNLMVPVYGAGDLAAHGIPAWQVVALAGVANLAVAAAGLVLALMGWQPRWQWIAGALLVAAGGLLVPVLLPIENPSVILLAATLAVYGFAAGFAQLAEQTTAVAGVADEGRRSEAIALIMRWHLVFGFVFGGIPFFFSWQAGQLGLSIVFASLAVFVAMLRRAPDPGIRERYGLRRAFRETGPGSLVVASGQAAWVSMYLLPGLHQMSAATVALYAGAAQVVAWVAMAWLKDMADRNQRLAAFISGIALLVAILGVAIVPAIMTTGAGIAVGLAFFVGGEVAANFFVTAIEGLISLEIGGQRAQLVGHATKFTAVGVAGGLFAILAGILTAHLGPALGAITLGGIIVVSLGAMFWVSSYALRLRHRPSAKEAAPVPDTPLVHETVIDVAGTRVRVSHCYGDGPTAVLVPGWRRNAKFWRHTIQWFAEQNQRAIAFDFQPDLNRSLFDQWVKILGSVLDRYDRGDERFVLVGHSMGAAKIGVYAAVREDPRIVGWSPIGAPGLEESKAAERDLRKARRVLRLPARFTQRYREALAAEWSAEPDSDRFTAEDVLVQTRLILRYMDELGGRFTPDAITGHARWIFLAYDRLWSLNASRSIASREGQLVQILQCRDVWRPSETWMVAGAVLDFVRECAREAGGSRRWRPGL